MGLPYAFADFINPNGAEIARSYRERFVPTGRAAEPYVIVALWVVCAPSAEDAEILASSAHMVLTLLHRGELIPVPSTEKAQRFLAEDLQQGPRVPPIYRPERRRIVGTPEVVRREIERVREEYLADEVMVVTITYDHEARKRSYELLARVFGE